MQTEFITHSPTETEELGARLATVLKEAGVRRAFVAFYGEMGVGKTAFVRGFASVVSPAAQVRSPTFALVNEYRGDPLSVFHFDMYRIGDEDELYSIGFYDYLSKGFCLCEWSENIEYALPEEYLKAEISRTGRDDNERSITVTLVKYDQI
jgi:tRNA threonylcarbamoyladenosine biosynthesis protein TsaE